MADIPPPVSAAPETIEMAVSEHLDMISRLNQVERVISAQGVRISDISAKVSSLAVDVGRVADTGTTNQLTLERVERMLGEIKRDLGRIFGSKT
jgi:hypothetical protein